MDWSTELRLWIKDVGFPIVVCLLAIYALYKMFMMKEDSDKSLRVSLEKHADKIADVSKNSSTAIDGNTQATRDLTSIIQKNIGSDPDGKICQARMLAAVLAEEKIILKANEAAILLKKRAEEAEKKLANRVEEIKAELAPQL